MAEEQQEKAESKRAARRRKWETPGRVLGLLCGLYFLVIFIKTVQTGYLTWIGITIGTLIFVPVFISPICGLFGKKRIEKVLTGLWGGIVILIILITLVTLVWPEDNHTWLPYRFDAELAALEAKRNVPDEENAAIRYESLFTKIDIHDQTDFFEELREKPWTSDDLPEASKWLDEHFEIIDELLKIGMMEKCRWPIQIEIGDDSEDYTVPYKPLRYFVRLIIAAGNRDLGLGQYQKAMEKYFCLLRMAEHLYQQSTELDLHSGFYREYLALQMIKHILVKNDLQKDDLDLIAGHIPTVEDNWQQNISKLMEYEKFRFVNIMSVAYEINEKGQVRFSEASGTLFLDKFMWEHPKRTDRLRRLYRLISMPLDPDGVWDMAESEAARFSHFLEQDQMPDIDKVTDEWLFGSFTDMVANLHRWAAKGMCFNKPLYAEFKQFYLSHVTQRRGTWLMLGLRKYRDEYGTWPESLELVSEYVPTEAFIDITNGDGFVFIREGDSFRLYSKGFNGIDDGGQDIGKSKDDIAIWPLKERVIREEIKENEAVTSNEN